MQNKCKRGFFTTILNMNTKSPGIKAKEEMSKWYKESLPLQVKKVTGPRPMPSLSRKSQSKSRSPLQNKDYDEISIEDMMDDKFEKEEENLKNAEDLTKMQKNVMQLDVGGYKFKTTSDTLTKISCKLSKIVDIKSTADLS